MNGVSRQTTFCTLTYGVVSLGRVMKAELGHTRLELCSPEEFANLGERLASTCGQEWGNGVSELWSHLYEEVSSYAIDPEGNYPIRGPRPVPRWRMGGDQLVHRINQMLWHGSVICQGLDRYLEGTTLTDAVLTMDTVNGNPGSTVEEVAETLWNARRVQIAQFNAEAESSTSTNAEAEASAAAATVATTAYRGNTAWSEDSRGYTQLDYEEVHSDVY